MTRLTTKQHWPISWPEDGVKDRRYTITMEFTGNFNNIGQPDYVFRFCDTFQNAFINYSDALEAANNHANKQNKQKD